MDTDILIIGAGPTGLMRFSFTLEAAHAGLQASACYFLRPDGYVAYAIITQLKNLVAHPEG